MSMGMRDVARRNGLLRDGMLTSPRAPEDCRHHTAEHAMLPAEPRAPTSSGSETQRVQIDTRSHTHSVRRE